MNDDLWGEEPFNDMPEEAHLDEGGGQKQAPPVSFPRTQKPVEDVKLVANSYNDYEQENLEVDPEDFTDVLNDANLRIEQGRLYQMIMNHNLFENMDADPKAIANVEKEIKKFARESMEVMLGMRQTVPVHAEGGAVITPFNALEVEILKKLASKATNGATETAEANKMADVIKEKKTTLSPIGSKKVVQAQPSMKKALPTRTQAPIKRSRLDATIDQIAREEGIPRELLEENYKPLKKPVEQMTDQEKLDRNKEIAVRRGTQAKSQSALPMATPEQAEFLAMQRAAQVSQGPGMINLLEIVKRMPVGKKS